MSQFAFYEFFGWALRLLLAQAVVFIFALLNVVSLSLPHAGDLKPFFLLTAVYYWAIYRPTVMPLVYTFCLGLLLDILGNLPLGVTAIILVGLQYLVQRSRLFLMGQPYAMVWLGFSLLSFAYAFLMWILISFFNLTFLPFQSFLQSLIAACLTILLFPLASLLLQSIHRLLPTSYNPVRIRG